MKEWTITLTLDKSLIPTKLCGHNQTWGTNIDKHNICTQIMAMALAHFLQALSVMGSQLPNSPLHYNNLSINPSNNIQPTAAASAQASMKSYTLINVPASRNQQMGTPNSSTAASPRRTAGIPRPHRYPYKRCSNYNCNTNDTPMCRRGHLGPKICKLFHIIVIITICRLENSNSLMHPHA